LESGSDQCEGITLIGPGSVFEGAESDSYRVSLNNKTLGPGQSLIFTVDSESGSATENVDFGALTFDALLPAVGITLSNISTNGTTGAVTVTATNTSGNTLGSGTELLSFRIFAFPDNIFPEQETFFITLTSLTTNVCVDEVETAILQGQTNWWRAVGSNGYVSGWLPTATTEAYWQGAGNNNLVSPANRIWLSPKQICVISQSGFVGGGLGLLGAGPKGSNSISFPFINYLGSLNINGPRCLICDPTFTFEFTNNPS